MLDMSTQSYFLAAAFISALESAALEADMV
jgi:hypothetical protein